MPELSAAQFTALLLVGCVVIGAVGALLLRWSVLWADALAGGRPVPVPSFGKAFAVVALAWLGGMGLRLVLKYLASGLGESLGGMEGVFELAVSFLIHTALTAGLLPTSPRRAAGITAIHFLVEFALLAALVVLGMALATAAAVAID